MKHPLEKIADFGGGYRRISPFFSQYQPLSGFRGNKLMKYIDGFTKRPHEAARDVSGRRCVQSVKAGGAHDIYT